MASKEVDKNLYIPEKAKIVSIKSLTLNVKYFKIEMLERDKFIHRPGQFVMVTVYGVGEIPISIASPPNFKSNEFELIVKNVGNVSNAFHNLKEGDIIGIRGPIGTYFCPAGFEGKDLLFIAGGIGIVPLRSIILCVLKQHRDYRRIKILFGVKAVKRFLLLDEIESWSNIDNVDVYITVDPPAEGWDGHKGLITSLIPPLDIDAENTQVTIVGPPVMYKYVLGELEKKNIPHRNIYLSFERRMKCGIGKCGNCQMQNIYVCTEGPIFCYEKIKHLKEAVE